MEGFLYCWCDIVSKAKSGSLKHLGNGMEGSLRFLARKWLLVLSILRVFVNWILVTNFQMNINILMRALVI